MRCCVVCAPRVGVMVSNQLSPSGATVSAYTPQYSRCSRANDRCRSHAIDGMYSRFGGQIA